MKKLSIFTLTALAALIAGCASVPTDEPYKSAVKSWVGSDYDQLASRWGEPQSYADQFDGSKIIEYANIKKIYAKNGEQLSIPASCTTQFTVDPTGYIGYWRAKNGPCTVQ